MLKAVNLRKEFATTIAVDGVSLEARSGEILGLLGPNGAGKTTTIRMILNIIQPDAGSITFDGKPFSEDVRNRFGYLPEERGLYRKNKLLNTILYFASLKGIDTAEAKRRAYKWLERFDLLNQYQQRIETLSKGNQQKVQFIISILHDPALVILDEPFSGLDPVNQIHLKDILQELKHDGKAIVFSTHQMDQAEKLSDSICLINRGKMVLEGGVKEVKQRFGKNSIHLVYDGDGSFLKQLPFVRNANVYENYAELDLGTAMTSRDILSTISSKLEVRKFEYVEPSLNSIFLEVVGVPQQVEQPNNVAVTPQPPMSMNQHDPRLKKALLSVLIAAAATILTTALYVIRHQDEWIMSCVLLGGTIVSFAKYKNIQKKIKTEIAPSRQVGGESE